MACEKRAFTSKKQAHNAVREMGQTIRVYYHEECHAFHVTKERGGTANGRGFGHRRQRKLRHDRLTRKNNL